MVTRKEILHRFPFFRLGFITVCGFLAGLSGVIPIRLPLLFLAALLLLPWVLLFLADKILSYNNRWIAGVVISLALFLFSMERVKEVSWLVDHELKMLAGKRILYIGDVAEQPVQKEKSTKIVVRLVAFCQEGRWKNVSGKILAYTRKDSSSQLLFYGDRLVFSCILNVPESPVLPGSFDSRKFLSRKGIFLQAYIGKDRWMIITRRNAGFLLHTALTWRRNLLAILQKKGLKGQEFAVASALLLGYVDEIGSGVMKDYAATGVLHILSVSGMHVGMIFLVLEKLLCFLDRWRWGRVIRAISTILLIWGYALITGLSPAVLRAAAMLSLVIAGNSLKRTPETLNILAASCFFLLVWDPMLLTDMGFQLSYLSVAGIILIYKSIYSRIVFSQWLLDKIWALVAVSLAAQLATVPLSLYYFNQFPNYFLLANIFVVPFSNLIIYDGILALLLAGIPYVGFIPSFLLSWSVRILNGIIHFIGSLPGSVTHGLFLQVHEMILLYLLIISLGSFLGSKRRPWLFIFLSLLLILQGSFFVNKAGDAGKCRFIVYNARNSSLYDFTGRGASILAGNLALLDDPFFAENLKKSHQTLGVKPKYQLLSLPGIRNDGTFKDPGSFFKKGDFIQFHQKRIGIIHERIPQGTMRKLRLDWLIISGNPKIHLSDILRVFSVKVLIIDNSNKPWRVKEWTAEASKLKVTCVQVSAEGSFIAEF